MAAGKCIEIRGTVQGVGFRPWVYRLAREEGVLGQVSNDATGVRIEAFAPEAALRVFVERLRKEAPPAAHIDRLAWFPILTDAPPADFAIVDSRTEGERRASIPPDLATCDACLAEILDPNDRRYRYAFTSCTNCGPRFTIALGIPYDRAATTMAPFAMCTRCQREYDSPEDRRFHAQPNACPECGPRLRLERPDGSPIDGEGDAVARAARMLAQGKIVAVKGLGGWHLACDATSESAVRELRRRKRREEKPFAVMVVDLEHAEMLAEVGPIERGLLTSVERPIVLLARRAEADEAPSVAPESARFGLMLPYTPLHHLLLRDAGRPLVMTSGNLSEEPIACDDDDARARLGAIADAMLGHDRAIASRADDSVIAVCRGRPLPMRRSRGAVPRPILLARPFARPVLACGAHLKNTFCIGQGDAATLGPHIGDLENLETYDCYRRAILRLEEFLGVRPEVVAHDLHPDYLSTRYAREERAGLERVAVQHHHAHVASAMAEHGLEGPVIGVAFDGTGFGPDGTSWGGEVMVATYASYERVATLRPIRLAGGDWAVREPWRAALALLDDAYEGAPPLDRLALFHDLPPGDVAVVRRMLAAPFHAPLAHGAGRYFDALAAIGLARPRAAYEGQLALLWDDAASCHEGPLDPYPFAVDETKHPWSIDLRAMVRDAVDDLVGGAGAPHVAARFHATLAAATATAVRMVARAHAPLPVVLTGGCFQNVRLATAVVRELTPALTVHTHERVPPGDGGIALGQALVADAIVRLGRGG